MTAAPLGIVALNLGGPDSLGAVQPFLRNLFRDPDVIHLGWARPLQPLFARILASRRAAFSQEAYRQIGGRSPIAVESADQAAGVARELGVLGVVARSYVAMACWHPFSRETVAALLSDGVHRAVALPLYPHYSTTTTGSSFKALDRAVAGTDIEIARVNHYPDAPGYIEALADCVREAIATLPEDARDRAPVLFSAHGLPESYIEREIPISTKSASRSRR
jgi:protoporphyrin/coproporphyrin ferrochelatase